MARIGDICFATNRFELYMDYMHRMQARSPFLQTFTVQMAGTEESCYLASERGIANKGYSASLFCNQIGAEGGQQITAEYALTGDVTLYAQWEKVADITGWCKEDGRLYYMIDGQRVVGFFQTDGIAFGVDFVATDATAG